jgi:hypothetical protein
MMFFYEDGITVEGPSAAVKRMGGRITRMDAQGGLPRSSPRVRGLPLPGLLAQLLANGRWQHPGDEVLRQALPWFEGPVDFLGSTEDMERESRSQDVFAQGERNSRFFHVTRGAADGETALPWLDADLAVVIAVNREPGDDIAIALDYRGDAANPAVVASDVWTEPGAYLWRSVAPSFPAFAAMLGIGQPPMS